MPLVKPFNDVVPIEEANTPLASNQQFKADISFPARAAAPDLTRFGYLFRDLQADPANLLPTSPQTVQALKELGSTMNDPGNGLTLDSKIPSAYTYFGQFIDHDSTLMMIPGESKLNDPLSDPNLAPLLLTEIDKIKNLRTPALDLDSVYGEAPHVGDDLMQLGTVSPFGPRPPGKNGNDFDLPRTGRSADAERDRAPRIGDRRNEETAIIGQLHVAFLRAHNAIVRGGYGYCAARALLRRYYQLIVVHDFLRRVADPAVVDDMLSEPWERYDPPEDKFFMPLEFSAAAFRFGHSMVRDSYNFNNNFAPVSLLQLFNVLGQYPSLPERWIIQWENFVAGGPNRARLIDTQMAQSLFFVPGFPAGKEIRLPVRTLLRGYMLRLPTGQAVARALKLEPKEILSEADIEGVAERIPGGAQLNVLREERLLEDGTKWKLSGRTPLWFYILAEAAYFKDGQQLGPVGSRLVAGVLIALIRRSKDSVLKIPGWPPARDSKFTLSDLLRLARVL